jgi:hypothetical protein
LKNDVDITTTSIISGVSTLYITQNSIIDLLPNYVQGVNGTQGLTTMVGGEPKTATIRIQTYFYSNIVDTISKANELQITTNSIIANILPLVPKIIGKVYGSGTRGDKFGVNFTVTVESTGQYLLSFSGYTITSNTIMTATLNLTPAFATSSITIQYASANSARVNTYNGSSAQSLPFSFIIY